MVRSLTALDLLVVGECNPDLILSGGDLVPAFGQVEKIVGDARLQIGSSAAIMACGAARLGLRTALLAVVGDDPLGRFMRAELDARGVETRHLVVSDSLATGVTVILDRGTDRAILTAPGAIAALGEEHLDAGLIASARHVHVASYYLQPRLMPAVPGLFATAHAAGATTSLDTNWDPSERFDGGIRASLAACDLFLPNDAEARRIADRPEVGEAAALLAGMAGTVAVKLGADGALLRCGAAELRAWPAGPVSVRDAVGAGDSFDAGLIAGRLLGFDDAAALALGVACGSLSTGAAGGTGAQPTLAEALAFSVSGSASS